MNKANFFVWKNIQVKKRTREISKVFHSYHPYDHKVGIALCLFVCLFVSLFVCSCFFPLLLPSAPFPGSLSPLLGGGAGREERERATLGTRLPSFLPRFRFSPACPFVG